jgi:hypothetical protein
MARAKKPTAAFMGDESALKSPRAMESQAQSISARIRAQVRAMWLLQRDLPVPDDLLVDARGQAQNPELPRDVLQYPLSLEEHLMRGIRTQREAGGTRSNGRHDAESAAAPPGFRWRTDGTLEPLEGLVESVLEMREKHLQSHVRRRLQVLERLPTMNMPQWLQDKVERETRALRLLELQREVRDALSSCHVDVSVPPPGDAAQYVDTGSVSALTKEDVERAWEEQSRVAEERHCASKRQVRRRKQHAGAQSWVPIRLTRGCARALDRRFSRKWRTRSGASQSAGSTCGACGSRSVSRSRRGTRTQKRRATRSAWSVLLRSRTTTSTSHRPPEASRACLRAMAQMASETAPARAELQRDCALRPEGSLVR